MGVLSAVAVGAAFVAAGWLPTSARWNDTQLPIPYCISANAQNTSATAAEQRQAVLAGINAWTASGSGGSVSCTTYTAQAATYACSTAVNVRDGRFNLFWERNWGNGSAALGVTWSSGNGRNCGSVRDDTGTNHNLQCKFDSDIEFNDRDFFWSATNSRPRTDIQSIVVHEYGHFLGLDHCSSNGTCGLGTGVMNAFYAGGISRVPFTDDVEGVCGLYPGQQGGLGSPCQRNSDCRSSLCVGPSGSMYCSETCSGASCPAGYRCGAGPGGQSVCLRDNGLERGQCEVCQLNTPSACRDNGLCVRGLPETDGGRCVAPCRAGGACDADYQCLTVQFQGGGSADHCFPRSNDCNAPGNFTELQLGQRCDGSQPCAGGLTCVGICAPSCAAGEACPADWACETGFREGAYCLPAVTEGQDCTGFVTCSVGPCLSSQPDQATCFRDCADDAGACNAAQTCNTYNLQGGGQVSICEPPGVPPPAPDAGVVLPDAGAEPPDAGVEPPDSGMSTIDAGGPSGSKAPNGCACDATFACDDDGQGGACACDLECSCPCDTTSACDPQCQACDPECLCECDITFACDPNCQRCDPECGPGGLSGPADSCACVAVEPRAGGWRVLAALLGLALIGSRPRRRALGPRDALSREARPSSGAPRRSGG